MTSRSRSLAWLTAALSVAGCGDNGVGPQDASTDGGVSTNQPDSSSTDDGATDAPVILTTIRIAHLTAALGPIDFCYRAPSTQNFVGPLLSPPPDAGPVPDGSSEDAEAGDASIEAGDGAPQDAAADAPRDGTASDASLDGALADAAEDGEAGLGSGLAPLHVTAYLSIPSDGTFEIAIVAANTESCDHALLTQKVTLDAGKHTTLAIMGFLPADAGPAAGLGLVSLTDDPTPQAGSFRARMVDAALGSTSVPPLGRLSVSVTDAQGTRAMLAGAVEPREASTPSQTPPTVDALGYHSGAPLMAPLSLECDPARDAGSGAWTSASFDPSLAAGSIHTGFVVNDYDGDLAVLWCNDPGIGDRKTSCSLVRGNGL